MENATPTLRLGSRGIAVRDLQVLLNSAKANPPLTVDRFFGKSTDGAVRVFQRRVGLVVDGLAGRQTITALKRAVEPVKPGKQEPDKSAMVAQTPASNAVVLARSPALPPPNASSLQLLSTARPIAEIIVHCAATPEGKDFTVADIRAWHKARGWSDIGYHYVVYRDGRIMLGRPIGQVGAHVENRNEGTAGVVYIGGVTANGKTAKDTRTPAQRASLLWLSQQLVAKHRGVRRISGHNQYSSKACPSFDVRRDPLSTQPFQSRK